MTRFMRFICRLLGKHDKRAVVMSLQDEFGNTEHLYWFRCGRCDYFEEMPQASADVMRGLFEPEPDKYVHEPQSYELQ